MKYAKKDSKNDLSMLSVAPIIMNTPPEATTQVFEFIEKENFNFDKRCDICIASKFEG